MAIPLSVPYAAEVAEISQDLPTLHWIAESSHGVVLQEGVSLPKVEEQLTIQSDSLLSLFLLIGIALFMLELIIRKWPVSKKRQR